MRCIPLFATLGPVSRAADLPDYDRPPVDEVAIGYLFLPVLGYSDSLVGAFWQTVRSDYPRTEAQPRVEAPLESLDPKAPPAQQTIVPPVAPDQGRTWFISANDEFVVQIQNSRFFINWRKRHDEYPHFDQIRPRFMSLFRDYARFLEENGCGRPGVQQLEVSYINWIPDMLVSEFFRPAASASVRVRGLSESPAEMAWAARYMVNGPTGEPKATLHIQCMPALRMNPPGRGSQLNLTYRAPLLQEPTEEMLDDLAEVGRDAIVRTFTTLTTDGAHDAWGLKK